MGEGNDPQAVVDAMATHEETMSALYSAYAESYPDVSDLWMKMAREEHGHSKLLRSLLDHPDDLAPFADERRFPLDQIAGETKRLRNLVHVAPRAGLTMPEAFLVAKRLEDTLIESHVLKPAEGDPEPVVKVLGALQEQTERHRAHLREVLDAGGKS